MSEVRISLNALLAGTSKDDRVIIDGNDITRSVRGLRYEADVGRMPQLTVDLAVFDVTKIESKNTEVLLDSSTAQLLIDAGWTPPPGEPRWLALKPGEAKEVP